MSFLPASMGGAERKKAMWLAGLVIVIPIAYFLSKASSDTPESSSTSSSAKTKQGPADPTAALGPAVNAPVVRKEAPSIMPMKRTPQGGMSRGGGRATEDFKPSLKPKEGVDVSAIDPTLHLDRLARLHNLAMEGGARSVFKEGSAPPPEAPKQVFIAVGPKPSDAQQVQVVPTPPPGPPPTPPPTPIPLKFYGFASAARSGGAKKAFFLDGEDIQIAGENDVIRNRYKIIRIGVNSAVVEDTTDKHQQTLPLVEEFAG
jgi:hypothetical protein